MKKEYKMSFDNFNWNVDLERDHTREFTVYDDNNSITVRVSTEIVSRHEKIRIIELLNMIAYEEEVPYQIKADGCIWTYEKSFGQYKNDNFQELIKYLHAGLTYPALLNCEVEIV